jgi:hypothetical protein
MHLAPTTLHPTMIHADLATMRTPGRVSEIVARGSYGLREGYTSLETAIRHLHSLTGGDSRTGAAIVQQGDRYYGVRVLEKISDPTTRSGLRGAWMRIERESSVEIAPFNRHAALRAVIDGSTIIRVRP